MVLVAQSVALFCIFLGLIFFLYVHGFTFRRMRRQERELVLKDAEADRMEELAESAPRVALSGPDSTRNQEALFYLYEEQVRRFIDAKIAIMRTSAETQNRILLMQAEVGIGISSPHAPLLLESALRNGRDAHPVNVPAVCQNDADQGNAGRDELGLQLAQQAQNVRSETKRHLAEIERQMRSIPGASIDQWVITLKNE